MRLDNTKLQWISTKLLPVRGGDIHIPSEQTAFAGKIIHNSPGKRKIKRILWPLYKTLTDPVCDGFIERFAEREILRLWTPHTRFLEVACGDMSIARFLPKHAWYNAFDFELNDIFLESLIAQRSTANVALASVENIPLADGCVDLFVCMQAFIHFPDFNKAIDEIVRVSAPRAKLICSIANHHASLYKIRGPHPDATKDWTFDDFKSDMSRKGFRLIKAEQRGIWVRTPDWLTKRTVVLPVTAKSENRNVVFLYVFELDKRDGPSCLNTE